MATLLAQSLCEEQFMETTDQTIDTIIAIVNRVRTPTYGLDNGCNPFP
jgi:hypothetical protein